MKIEISEEEALVLFEFFERFDDTGQLLFVHAAEYIALQNIAGQVTKGSSAMFQPDYKNSLDKARDKVSIGYEGETPLLGSESTR